MANRFPPTHRELTRSAQLSPKQRTVKKINDRRANQHAFVPGNGHPHLCAHCNAEMGDLYNNRRIHPTQEGSTE